MNHNIRHLVAQPSEPYSEANPQHTNRTDNQKIIQKPIFRFICRNQDTERKHKKETAFN